jgi:hypothetical protein
MGVAVGRLAAGERIQRTVGEHDRHRIGVLDPERVESDAITRERRRLDRHDGFGGSSWQQGSVEEDAASVIGRGAHR